MRTRTRIRIAARKFFRLFDPRWWRLRLLKRRYRKELDRFYVKNREDDFVAVSKEAFFNGYVFCPYVPLFIAPTFPMSYKEQTADLKKRIARMERGEQPYETVRSEDGRIEYWK